MLLLLTSLLLSSWTLSLLTLPGRFDLVQESSLRLYSSKEEPDPLLLARIFRPTLLLDGSSADCENFSVERKACLILYARLSVGSIICASGLRQELVLQRRLRACVWMCPVVVLFLKPLTF